MSRLLGVVMSMTLIIGPFGAEDVPYERRRDQPKDINPVPRKRAPKPRRRAAPPHWMDRPRRGPKPGTIREALAAAEKKRAKRRERYMAPED